jgi:sulfite exporter TauE/SafE/copper chaperone CopZ
VEQRLIRKILQIGGMTCTSCEMRIENRLKKIEGVIGVKAIYSSSNVYVTYDAGVVGLDAIIEAIEKLDYIVKNAPGSRAGADQPREKKKASGDKMPVSHLLGIGIIVFALYVIIKNTVGFNFIPQVNQNMGYGILFVVGLITSLHCIAMCGGINLSQCVSYKRAEADAGGLSKLKPSIMYNTGRVISYTIVGGIVGALGSVISFSGTAKGIVAVLSGVFMVIMGLNMLNIFPWLRRLNPRMPRIFGERIHNSSGRRGPFYVGLFNGLMPCGPLQAMQIYALGTGSFFAGALSMFMFSLGTVPLMFGFGAVSSFLSGRFTRRMMKVSAVLVMILGIIMLNRGLNLSGINLGGVAYASSAASGNIAQIDGNVQVVTTELESGRYTPFIVQEGIPVKWTIKADEKDINGCNETIIIPKYGISKKLVPGENLIEFTPEEEGDIPYTCWMGMISSNIKVVPDITNVSGTDAAQSNASSGGGLLGGGCCGPTPPQFADGKIPTDNIQVAEVKDGQQVVTITVNDQGYTPAVAVIQKGVKVKIKFNGEQLNACNSIAVFPEYQGQLDLSSQPETPWLTPTQDFTFQCGMDMLHGYVKVVEDINNVNLDDIRSEIENYTPPAGTGGKSCCKR